MIDSYRQKILVRCAAVIRFKYPDKMKFRDCCFPGQFIQRQIFSIILIDILFGCNDFCGVIGFGINLFRNPCQFTEEKCFIVGMFQSGKF